MKNFVFALVDNNIDTRIKTKNGLSVLLDYDTYLDILTLCHMEEWEILHDDAGMTVFDAKIDSSKYSLGNIEEAIKSGDRRMMDMLCAGRRLYYLQLQDVARKRERQKEFVDKAKETFRKNKIDSDGPWNVAMYKEPERANVAVYEGEEWD